MVMTIALTKMILMVIIIIIIIIMLTTKDDDCLDMHPPPTILYECMDRAVWYPQSVLSVLFGVM